MLNTVAPMCEDVSARVTIDRPAPGAYRLLLDGEQIGSATFGRAGEVVHGCGWGLIEEWQGRGIMTRVLPMLLDEQAAAGVRVIRTVIADDNEPSWRLATRCGFRRGPRFGDLRGALMHTWLLELPASAAADTVGT